MWITLVEKLRLRNIAFKSICDGSIDTTIASGELVFNIFSSLAQFEQRLIKEKEHEQDLKPQGQEAS
ncbi:MAG: recombinase family protein [Candidatus Rickettsia vulgarisii]